MISLIIGILLILYAIGSVAFCVIRTPENLRGFYGVMYTIISIGSLVGGVCLLLTYFGIL